MLIGKLRKPLAFILALVLCTCLLAVQVFADPAQEEEGDITIPIVPGETVDPGDEEDDSCGENLTWTLDEDGVLTISGTGTTLSAAPWDKAAVKSVVFEAVLTVIKKDLFAESTAVTDVFWGGTAQQWGDMSIVAGNDVLSYAKLHYGYAETTFCNRTCVYCPGCEKNLLFTGEEVKHSFTDYTYNNDATLEKDGTETAYCDNGCGESDTRTAEGTKLPQTGWVQDGETWYYYNKGKMVTGWLEYGPVWYYFNPEGDMRLGWLTYGGHKYFFDKATTNYGRMAVNKWIQDGGEWYYFDADGHMVTGEVTIGDAVHIFDEDGVWQGEKASDTVTKGWVQEEGKWYYYKDGAKVTGWLDLNGTWYYFKTSGEMVTGWLAYGPVWYYFNSNGDMRLGWLTYGGKNYFFDKATTNYGRMAVNKWIQDSGKWYYFDGNGYMVTGSYTINGVKNIFDENGVWQGEEAVKKGWIQEGGEWYYYEDGTKKTGWLMLGDYWYWLDPNNGGAMCHDIWAIIGDYVVYFSPDGYMYKNGTYVIGGESYTFDENGWCVNPPEFQ